MESFNRCLRLIPPGLYNACVVRNFKHTKHEPRKTMKNTNPATRRWPGCFFGGDWGNSALASLWLATQRLDIPSCQNEETWDWIWMVRSVGFFFGSALNAAGFLLKPSCNEFQLLSINSSNIIQPTSQSNVMYWRVFFPDRCCSWMSHRQLLTLEQNVTCGKWLKLVRLISILSWKQIWMMNLM